MAEPKLKPVERRLPITIVPRRRLDEEQQKVLREGFARVQQGIKSLQDYAGKLKVTPTKRTRESLLKEAENLRRTLKAMGITPESVPILGERYQNEIEMILKIVADAEKAAKGGNLPLAARKLDEARAKTVKLGDVYEIQLNLLMAGVPENIGIPGVNSADAYNELFDALENLLLDVGTSNEKRALVMFRLAKGISSNALLHNMESADITAHRNNGFALIVERGNDAKEGVQYTQFDSDRKFVLAFEKETSEIKTQVVGSLSSVLGGWISHLRQIARAESDETRKRMLDKLRKDLEAIQKRLKDKKQIDLEALAGIETRFYAATGTQKPLTERETVEAMVARATQLRGDKKKINDYSQEWYAQKALDAFEQGRNAAGRLALLMAMLEYSAKGKGAAYLHPADYEEIRAVIETGAGFTPGRGQWYAGKIEAAAQAAEINELGKTKAKGKKKELIAKALKSAHSNPRLLDMVSTYVQLGEQNGWRDFSGSADLEAAIRKEIEGEDGTAEFSLGMAMFEMSTAIGDARKATAGWRNKKQKNVAAQALKRAEQHLKQGEIQEAQRILTLISMYAEAVDKVAGKRLISKDDAERVSGMERAVAALAEGESRVDGKEIEAVFMESYRATQNAYLSMRANALGKLAEKRPVGKETIDRALETARERAGKGDFEGAYRLLEYVADYYGQGKNEGWRYKLAKTEVPGYVAGRTEMLEAIRMEIEATSVVGQAAAAQRFDSGTGKIATTLALTNQAYDITQAYRSKKPFEKGQPNGQLPIGEKRADGKYSRYVSFDAIRRYESRHAYKGPEQGDRDLAGPTLEQLAKRMTEAARTGSVTEYNEAVEAFNARLELVATKAVNAGNMSTFNKQMKALMQTLDQIDGIYAGMKPSNALAVRRAETARVRKRVKYYYDKVAKTGNIDYAEYAEILREVEGERKIASGVAQLNGQIQANKAYRDATLSQRWEVGHRVGRIIEQASEELEQAQQALMYGSPSSRRRAKKHYEKAVQLKTYAMVLYRAEDAATLEQLLTLVPGGKPRETDMAVGVDTRFFPQYRAAAAFREFDSYGEARMAAFSALIEGTENPERVNALLEAAGNIEISIFAVPAHSIAQRLSDFVPAQRRIRERFAAAMAGDNITALKVANAQARTDIQVMQRNVRDNITTEQMTLMGAGIAAACIPFYGVYISGGIFTALSIDNIAMEYRRNGYASAESWAMLGLVIVGTGMVAAASRMGSLARYWGTAERGLKYQQIAQRLGQVNLGFGLAMSGYIGYHGIVQLTSEEGDPRLGTFMLGMALFPWALMGGMKAAGALGARIPTIRARAFRQQVAEGIVPRPEMEPARIEPIEPVRVRHAREISTPQRLFEFLGYLRGQNAAGRAAALRGLPARLRPKVAALLDNTAVRSALETGEVSEFTLAALRRTISEFDLPPPTGPRGPAGRPITAGEWSAAELMDPVRLGRFLSDLLIPDNAPAEALAARSAAQRLLQQMRSDPHTLRIANEIDLLLAREPFAIGIRTGSNDPITLNTLRRTSRMVADTLEPEVVEMAMNAPPPVESQQPVPPGILPKGAGTAEVIPIRASAGEAGPGQVVTGETTGTSVGGATGRTVRGGRAPPVRPAEAPAETAAAEQAKPAGSKVWKYTGGAAWKGVKWAWGRPAAIRSWARGEGAMQRIAGAPEEVTVKVGAAMRKADAYKIVDFMRMLYRRYSDPRTSKAVKEECYETIRALLRRRDVRQVIDASGPDPEIGAIQRDIIVPIKQEAAQSGGEAYYQSIPELNHQQRSLVLDVIEMEGAAKNHEPLAMVQQELGVRFSPQERAEILINRMQDGKVPPAVLRIELARARIEAETIVSETIPHTETQNAVQQELLARIGRNEGGSLDDALMEILRGPRVRDSIDPGSTKAFEEALGQGNIERVLAAIERDVPEGRQIAAYIRSIRSSKPLADNFAEIGIVRDPIATIESAERTARAEEASKRRKFAVEHASWWKETAAPGVGKFLWKGRWIASPWGAIRYGGGAARAGWKQGWRAGVRELWPPGWVNVGHTAAWGLGAYYGYQWYRGDVTGKQEEILKKYNAHISEDSAAFLLTEQGQEMWSLILLEQPTAAELDQQTGANLRKALLDETMFVRPDRLEEALQDGMEMAEQLPTLNAYLKQGDEQSVRKILDPMGISYEEARALYSKKGDLTLMDMRHLRMNDWAQRGVARRLRDIHAERFAGQMDIEGELPGITVSKINKILDTGSTADQNRSIDEVLAGTYLTHHDVRRVLESRDALTAKESAALGRISRQNFLSRNHQVLGFLITSYREGHIPYVYMNDAVGTVMTNYSEWQKKVTDKKPMETIMKEGLKLKTSQFYLEVPAGEGKTTGIERYSFLGLLDDRAKANKKFRDEVARPVFDTYRGLPAALQRFNAFGATSHRAKKGEDTIRTEALYGSRAEITEVATRIVGDKTTWVAEDGKPNLDPQVAAKNAEAALKYAREQRIIAPKIFNQDGTMTTEDTARLLRFVYARSGVSAAGSPSGGLYRWIADNRQSITNLLEILKNMEADPATATMTADSIVRYASRRASIYRERGWWTGDLPEEKVEEKKGKGKGKKAPPEPQELQRGSTRVEGKEAEAPAPAVLTEEQTSFYKQEGVGQFLAAYVEKAIEDIYAGSEGDVAQKKAKEKFGEDKEQAKIAAKVELYGIITGTSPRARRERTASGLKVAEDGTVSFREESSSERRGKVVSFIKRFINEKRR